MPDKQTVLVVTVLLIVLATGGIAQGTVFYVDASATGANNGTSWADAFTSIQAGIDAANNALPGAEVWVKAGRYTGCNSPPFSDSFEARHPDSVDIIGQETGGKYTEWPYANLEFHATVFFLTGDTTVTPPPISFGSTTEIDSFVKRYSALVQCNPDTLVVLCHPSRAGTAISKENITAAANAGVLYTMEIKNQQDVDKWDYALANLDDQAGSCSKIVWGIRCEDQHYYQNVGQPIMMGIIPTSREDPVYSNRRLAFKDMMRRGSIVALADVGKCSVPVYSCISDSGTASRLDISVWLEPKGVTSAKIRLYGCDWQTGANPGTLLREIAVTPGQQCTVSYYFTSNGDVGGTPLTAQQKANIKYLRPVLVFTKDSNTREVYFQPVRIRSNGDWWNGPSYTLAGGHATIGPSPYPSGIGKDTGETIYFNTHTHTLMSDGNVTPQAMRLVYWQKYGVLDPSKPRFCIITDHDFSSPFAPPTRSVIVLREGAEVYGGFAGWETSRDQRDWKTNVTIIDAQLQGRGVLCDSSGWANPSNAVLDGFTITNGKVDGSNAGGGMLNWQSALKVENCTFVNNQAPMGAGIMNSLSTPTITACTFQNNSAGSNPTWRSGGGMTNEGLGAVVTNCTFVGNTARRGGGMFNASDCNITGCTFDSNATAGFITSYGGGIYNYRSSPKITACTFQNNQANTIDGNGGAIYNREASPTISRCIFRNNHCDSNFGKGGAIRNYKSAVTVTDCIFYGNTTAGYQGTGAAIFHEGDSAAFLTNNTIAYNSASVHGGIYCLQSSPSLYNNIVAFNTGGGIVRDSGNPILGYNDVYGNGQNYVNLSAGLGDISEDPRFANPSKGDYHLMPSSPCVDSGSNSAPAVPSFDMECEQRPWGPTVDIGADEFLPASRMALYAKGRQDDEPISLSGMVISAAFTDDFYVESSDRCWGIRVDKPGHSFAAGMKVDVEGLVETGTNGERYILATTVSQSGTGSVLPVYLTNKFLGGEDLYYDGITGQKGVKNGYGPNNIGLLVSTCGRLTYVGDNYFYIDDGSKVKDNSTHVGVKVIGTVPCVSPIGKYVRVTGIVSCFKAGEELYPLLRSTEVTLIE